MSATNVVRRRKAGGTWAVNIEVPVRTPSYHRVYSTRRIKKRRTPGKLFLTFVRYGLWIAVIFLIGRWTFVGLSKPIRLLKEQYQQSQTLTRQLQSMKAEHKVLKRRLAYLQTEQGQMQEARNLGFVKPGEIVLILPPEPSSKQKNSASH